MDCSPDAVGRVPESCGNQIVEHASNYRLHVIEVDDQGRPYANRDAFGEAHAQVNAFLSSIREDTEPSDTNGGVSVVMFVHGWKHGSSANDTNLMEFRKLLEGLAHVEKKVCQRKVVGAYVGWRGAALRGVAKYTPVDWLETFSFWSRKRSAERISRGVIQEAIGGLKAIQHKTRLERLVREGPEALAANGDGRNCDSMLKTTLVGHSFGGHILVSAMSQTLIEDAALDRELLPLSEELQTNVPPDELVIVVNPAIEGAQFDALSRLSRRIDYPYYRSPRFISITSTGDRATRIAFTLGRGASAWYKRFPDDDRLGRRAWVTAMGHDPQYLTHRLVRWIDLPEAQRPTTDLSQCSQWSNTRSYIDRANIDIERAKNFFRPNNGRFNADAKDALPRVYCSQRLRDETEPGSDLLVLDRFVDSTNDQPVNLNAPVWNVVTHPPVLYGHGDFTNTLLVEFVRQLYVESLYVK